MLAIMILGTAPAAPGSRLPAPASKSLELTESRRFPRRVPLCAALECAGPGLAVVPRYRDTFRKKHKINKYKEYKYKYKYK